MVRCLPHKPKGLSSIASAHIKLNLAMHTCILLMEEQRQPGTHQPARLIKEPQVPENDILSKYNVATPEATTPKIDL